MSLPRRFVPLLSAFLVAGCGHEPSTAVAVAEMHEGADLQFVIPAFSPELLMDHRGNVSDVREGFETAPASLLRPGEEEPERPDATALAAPTIWDASTDLTFHPKSLEAWAEHKYRGNKGRVEVTAFMREGGVAIGNRTGFEEGWHSWLSPFAHHVIANSIINLEKDCGLTADAQGKHEAWWEIAPGSGPSVFGKVGFSTTSGLASQPACPPTPTGGGGGGDGMSGDAAMCYIWLEYDLDSGEILDWQVIYCSGGG